MGIDYLKVVRLLSEVVVVVMRYEMRVVVAINAEIAFTTAFEKF